MRVGSSSLNYLLNQKWGCPNIAVNISGSRVTGETISTYFHQDYGHFLGVGASGYPAHMDDVINPIKSDSVITHAGNMVVATAYGENSQFYGYKLGGSFGGTHVYNLFPRVNNSGCSTIYVQRRVSADPLSGITWTSLPHYDTGVSGYLDSWMPIVDVSLTNGLSPWTYLYYLVCGGSRSTGFGASMILYENRASIYRFGTTDDGINWTGRTTIWSSSLGSSLLEVYSDDIGKTQYAGTILFSNKPTNISAVGESAIFINMTKNVERYARPVGQSRIMLPYGGAAGTGITYRDTWAENRFFETFCLTREKWGISTGLSRFVGTGLMHRMLYPNLKALSSTVPGRIANVFILGDPNLETFTGLNVYSFDAEGSSNFMFNRKELASHSLASQSSIIFNELTGQFETMLYCVGEISVTNTSAGYRIITRNFDQSADADVSITGSTRYTTGGLQTVLWGAKNIKNKFYLFNNHTNIIDDLYIEDDIDNNIKAQMRRVAIVGISYGMYTSVLDKYKTTSIELGGIIITTYGQIGYEERTRYVNQMNGTFHLFPGISFDYYINPNAIGNSTTSVALSQNHRDFSYDISGDIESYTNNNNKNIDLSFSDITT